MSLGFRVWGVLVLKVGRLGQQLLKQVCAVLESVFVDPWPVYSLGKTKGALTSSMGKQQAEPSSERLSGALWDMVWVLWQADDQYRAHLALFRYK